MRKKTLITALCLAASLAAQAQYPIASEGAWCWFADPRALHYENPSGSINASWLGCIDVHGTIKATQMDFVTGRQTDVLVRSQFQPDDHDNPSFLVLPDERVMLIYSRHTDEPAFYYRVSRKPGDITTLGDEKKIEVADNTTYPSPFIMSDDPTHFYLCWRGINWHPTIARLTLPDTNDEVTIDWGPHQLVQSTGARPYAKYYSNGKDKLYVAYTTGHPDNELPNWLYFNVINISTADNGGSPVLEDIEGNRLADIASGPFQINKTPEYLEKYPLTVVDAPSDSRAWVWQIALDKEQRPRIAMVHISPDKSQHEYFYGRWTGTEWALTDVCDGGGKYHSSDTEYCYSGGMTLDQQDPSRLYVSKPVEGENGSFFEIWRYILSDDGQVKERAAVTRNSSVNNVRPFILPGSQGSPLRLGWLMGDYYFWIVCQRYPQGYPTTLVADYQMPEVSEIWNTPLEPDFVSSPEDLGEGGWTITFICSLPQDAYYGTLVSAPGFTYGVSEEGAYPYVETSAGKSASPCALMNSDDWALYASGTGGSWPTKLKQVCLTLTFDGKELCTYRDGLLDQRLEAPELSGVRLSPQAFGSAVSDVKALRGALSPMEVKALILQHFATYMTRD